MSFQAPSLNDLLITSMDLCECFALDDVSVALRGRVIEASVPALVLAPMQGVTDAPMRALMSEFGGFAFCVTEFLRIAQNVPGIRAFHTHAPEFATACRTPAGLPVQVQLLGGDPERLARAAQVAVKAGSRAVDLNFGCPAPTVNRHDGGAMMLNHPHRNWAPPIASSTSFSHAPVRHAVSRVSITRRGDRGAIQVN